MSVQPARTSRVRRWPYLCVALVSVLTVPLVFGMLLFVGLALVFGGGVVGAVTGHGPAFERAVRVLIFGCALLVGPAGYLLLALGQ